MMNASMELDYSSFDSTIRDAAGTTMQTKSQDFNQRYFLNMNLAPFPTVKITAGLIAGKDVNDMDSSGASIRTTSTNIQPSFTLEWADPFRVYSAGVGFSRRETTESFQNSPETTLVNDVTYATFRWHPLELPPFDLQFSRMNTYDQNRVFEDMTIDTATLSSRYAPVHPLKLNYAGSYTDTRDSITSLDIQSINQNAGTTFSNLYWGGRVSLTTGYSGNTSRTETSLQGTGTVDFQVFPQAGYSGVSDNLILDILTVNGDLIDTKTAVSAGVNIGSSLTLAGDTKPREAGVGFFSPTDVNNVLIWVNQQLTPQVASSFSWDIYTSNDNRNWKFLTTVSAAPFGPFENRFSLNFQAVQTQYLKVVTRPLAITVQGANLPANQNIFITEMQVFLKRPATQVRGESSQSLQTYNLSVRTQILDGPTNLSHDFSFLGADSHATGRPSDTYYTFSNGLNALHRFSTVWTGSGRIAWGESANSDGRRSDLYTWSAVFSALPLKTFRSSIVYSGQVSSDNQQRTTDNALGLNATADLYPGISMTCSGAANDSRQNNGEASTSLNASTSLGLTPNSKVTLNFSASANRLRSWGGPLPAPTASSSSLMQAGATVRPTETIYLTASVARQSQSSAPSYTLQNYTVNWSPFSGGTLQFYFLYNENLRSDTDTLSKTVGPGLTWRLIPSSTLDLSYANITTTSPLSSQEIKSLSAVFKAVF